jgi:hypothetical protein
MTNDVNVPSKSYKQKNFLKIAIKNSRIRIRIKKRHGSADPDPHQNVLDPHHWFKPKNNAKCVLSRIFIVISGLAPQSLNPKL